MTKQSKLSARRRAPKINIHGPPAHNSAVVVNHTFRFLAMGSTSGQVSLQSLLATCGTIATVANTQGTKFVDSVKINSISIWSPPTSGSKVTLAWDSSAPIFTRPVVMSDTCLSTSVPAHIITRPPKSELYADWMCASSNSSDVNICLITVGAGAVIDVNLSFQLYTGSSNITSSTITYASGSAALGSVFYGYLDTSATHSFAPVDLVSNF